MMAQIHALTVKFGHFLVNYFCILGALCINPDVTPSGETRGPLGRPCPPCNDVYLVMSLAGCPRVNVVVQNELFVALVPRRNTWAFEVLQGNY